MVNTSLFRRIQLQLLMNLTARALGKTPERIWTRSNSEALKAYAEYTGSLLQEGIDDALWQRMNTDAYNMGRWLRRLFMVRNTARTQRLIIALYRNIGISLSFEDDDNFCFHHCYFSSYYTPDACRAASALDDGVIRGMMGVTAGRMCFCQRITEGCQCCLSSFKK